MNFVGYVGESNSLFFYILDIVVNITYLIIYLDVQDNNSLTEIHINIQIYIDF